MHHCQYFSFQAGTLANPEHLAKLKKGVKLWNQWRKQNPAVQPDFSGADLSKKTLVDADLRVANLRRTKLREATLDLADLTGADLRGAWLDRATLSEAELRGADLREAELSETDLGGADLTGADLSGGDLSGADLFDALLSEADLSKANLSGADLFLAHLIKSDLREANLEGADFHGADLEGADLSGANLSKAILVDTNLRGANLSGCSVYGISAWNVRLEGAIQSNLVITPGHESRIHVDNLEVAQFIYLLLDNEKIRSFIDTITSKAVLILGRFTPERRAVLEAIREQLRKRGYLPVLFDFIKPASKDLTGTISTLASLARFIIADLTDPSSVPHELATVVPGTVVPVQAIILEGQREYAMFVDLKTRYHWVLEPHRYRSQELLISQLGERVIGPAEGKAEELARKSKLL